MTKNSSNTEIERKFVVPLEYHHLFVNRLGGTEITQAYLSANPDMTVRLRISNNKIAKQTVKGRGTGAVRPEWEWDVPVSSALEIITLLNPPTVVKTRHAIYNGPDLWEVDVLRVNEVAGRPPGMWNYLVVAEFEAPSLEAVQSVVLPPWVGRDVTEDPAFLMSTLTTEATRDLAWRKAYL